MNVLFIGYWNLDDPLTISTILPHLKILSEMSKVTHLIFSNTQRVPLEVSDFDILKDIECTYEPIFSKNLPFNQINKIFDFIYFPRKLNKVIDKHQVDIIIARGAPAGSLAYLIWKARRIPFYVESYEPHAAYMLESGVWKRWDLRYLLQRHWERKIVQHSAGLMPVSKNYQKELVSKVGVASSRIVVVPCSVNQEKFRFDQEKAKEIRANLSIPQLSTVGIYVGKFGGIYYDEEAFKIFKSSFEYFNKSFFLIVLTDCAVDYVENRLAATDFPLEKCYIKKVSHNKVPDYLSASDFAFSTIKPSKHRRFCSPIKNGEYWANGLPILLTEGVGDDCEIIYKEGGGAIYDLGQEESLSRALLRIDRIISIPDYRADVASLARKYRKISFAQKAYQYFLGQ